MLPLNFFSRGLLPRSIPESFIEISPAISEWLQERSSEHCRQPDSDFDETRTSGAPGPKTKFCDPFLAQPAQPAHLAGPGASKVAIFGFLDKWPFGQIFFLSKPRDMFAMGFW